MDLRRPARLEELILEKLLQKIQNAGVSLSEVERRLGKGKDWTRQRTSGRYALTVLAALEILEAIGEDPKAFFAEAIPDKESNFSGVGPEIREIVELATGKAKKNKKRGDGS